MKLSTKLALHLSCLTIVVFSCVLANATNYYIAPAPTGKDSNNCTSASTPCLTFAHIETLAAAGDTINIAAGLYRLTAGTNGDYSISGGQIVPKDNQIFTGPACSPALSPTIVQCTAILSGSVQLAKAQILGPDSFGNYYATGFNQQGGNGNYPCDTGWAGCNFPEDLYVNASPYQRLDLTSEATLAAGTWWMNYSTSTIYLPSTLTPTFVNSNTVEIGVQDTSFYASGGANGVTIENLTIEEFASQNQPGGGLDPSYGKAPAPNFSTGWIVKNNFLTLNHSNGLRIALNMQGTNNVSYMNGQSGFGGGTPPGTAMTSSGVLIEDNTVENNNYDHMSPGFGAGGIKFGNSADVIVRGNTVANNLGNGIHFDVDSWNPLIDGNTVSNNLDTWDGGADFSASGTGIICEISAGGCTMRNNVVTFEGRGGTYGLQSSTSQGGAIYCNVVTETANNNELWQVNGTNRGFSTVPPNENLEYVSSGNYVHHNNFFWASGQDGLVGYRLNTYANSKLVETGTTVVVSSSTLLNVPAVGASMQIYGATPAGFNGVWTVTATTSSPITYTFTGAPSGLGSVTGTASGTSTDQPNFFTVNTAPNFNAYHASSTTGSWFIYDGVDSGIDTALPFFKNPPNETYQGNGADVDGTFDNLTTFPTVKITSPADEFGTSNSVTPPVTLDASASDGSGISKVEFYDLSTPTNWLLLGTDTTTPYNFTWSPTSGTHTVAAMAYSNAGVHNCWAITLNVN